MYICAYSLEHINENMQNIFGNKAAVGENFYGRSSFVKLLKSILISENSFLLLGLRRLGKSSAVKEALRKVDEEAPEIVIIELNCQTYKSLKDFYKELFRALPEDWKDKFRRLLVESKKLPTKIIDVITDHVEEVSIPLGPKVKLRNDIIEYANPIKEEITRFFKNEESHIVLSIDELPFLFESISKANNETTIIEIESVLTTLRDWRDIGISQAITGSINLHVQLENLGISKKLLAGLNTQKLPKFTEDEATGLLHALADSQNLKLKPEQIKEMVRIIPDFIPQFLQYYFHVVKTYYEEDSLDLEALYDEYVYPSILSDFEYQFDERLSKLSKVDFQTATELLNLISADGKKSQSEILYSIDSENTYSVLLKLLEFEILEMDTKQKYDFAFNLVRNWWNKGKI